MSSTSFFCLWFCVLIFHFVFWSWILICESYFVLSMMCQLKCFYVILYDVLTPINVGANMVMRDKSNMKWNNGIRIIRNKMNVNIKSTKMFSPSAIISMSPNMYNMQ